MGLWEFLRQWPRGRILAGVVASIVIHVLVVTGVLWGLAPGVAPKWKTKPGDTLIVELPKPDEPAAAGSPSPAPPPAPSPARVGTNPAPPAPPREERRVASAPRPAPPAPRAAEPAPPPAEPAARLTEAAPRAAEPPPPASEAVPRATESPRTAEPAAPAPPQLEGGERQIASLPPAGPTRPSASDVRAALGRGAGARGQGWGGIEGEPIPLDSPDAQYSEYMEQVRRRIKANWGYPCVKNHTTRGCDYLSAQLVVKFGIRKSGELQVVDIVRSSGYAIYDEYAINAIKLGSPYPPLPAAMMARLKTGNTGAPIIAHFTYILEASLTNVR